MTEEAKTRSLSSEVKVVDSIIASIFFTKAYFEGTSNVGDELFVQELMSLHGGTQLGGLIKYIHEQGALYSSTCDLPACFLR